MTNNEEIRTENARAESQSIECQKLIECLKSVQSPTPTLPPSVQDAIAKFEEIKAALIGSKQTDPKKEPKLWILPKPDEKTNSSSCIPQ